MQDGHCETTLHPKFVLCTLVLPFYNMIVRMPPFPRSYAGDSTVTLLRGIICICRGVSGRVKLSLSHVICLRNVCYNVLDREHVVPTMAETQAHCVDAVRSSLALQETMELPAASGMTPGHQMNPSW